MLCAIYVNSRLVSITWPTFLVCLGLMLSALRTCRLKVVQYFKNLVKYAVFERKIKMHFFNFKRFCHSPFQARAHIVPPPTNITAYLQMAWSLELQLCDFSFSEFSIRKISFTNKPSCMLLWQSWNFSAYFKNSNLRCFQVFPPERNFLWDNLLCFRHHNTLRSVIEAIIRGVIVERLHKIVLPKYDHRQLNNLLVPCFTVYN